MQLEVKERCSLTCDIEEFTLSSPTGVALPQAHAGAHLTLKTPSGASRRYSLVYPNAEPSSYTIAVKREQNSRGGSASMHDEAAVGLCLEVEAPQNDFALVAAQPSLLVAGGIGVTPIVSMAQHLAAEGVPFRVIYCTRSRAQSAYVELLEALCGDRLLVHHDDGQAEQVFDFWDTFAEPTTEHVYCCGPASLMEEVKAVSGHWPDGRIHFEDFKPIEVVRQDDTPFVVDLNRSSRSIKVPANRSVLEAIRDAGMVLASSCESGTCGTCKSVYLEGEVDHRDMVLMDEEKADHIMICVSRARGERLVLDL